jgi:hypothetical protein
LSQSHHQGLAGGSGRQRVAGSESFSRQIRSHLQVIFYIFKFGSVAIYDFVSSEFNMKHYFKFI